ncbi:hypothetical protein [Cognatilysobacter lacus]|uniref:Uncharacterized protein n=1 Tax=Cognatilysobacter lacus TaxID=1643323 RepID=A0A5D8YTK7_9GAMM|nr:hypothetical protein [Lysobacter lacus]TZF85242.1 hypothetical protein FW784_12380 [Lysobacter lacus]
MLALSDKGSLTVPKAPTRANVPSLTVAGFLVLALLVVVAAFGSYAWVYARFGLSHDPQDWATFGNYVGGVANPLLAFLTIALLAVTIVLQAKQLGISSRELELSRRELELTRSELKRSAQAQELSEKALKAQAEAAATSAKLATINALLSYYAGEIDRRKGINYPVGDPNHIAQRDALRRHRLLEQRLEYFFVELLGTEDQDEIQDR